MDFESTAIKYRRILIVGSTPYNLNTPARAFDAYFHGWKKENLAQIFSYPKKPCKGHCGYFCQITDKRMLQRTLGKKRPVEVFYEDSQLETAWKDGNKEVGNKFYKKLYSFGSGRKTPLIYLGRKLLWRKKLWCSDALNDWLDSFAPECVFLSFSDDFFLPQIALYVAQRYHIPIVSSIGDDYYFNDRPSLSPLYHIYKRAYRKLIRKVFAHGGSAIYISNKIRDKYNKEFGLNGETVYLASGLKRKPFAPINRENPVISYFGNIRQGRNESLNAIGYALGKINPEYKLHIYSGQTEPETTGLFYENPNVVFHGSIPYSQVEQKTRESDIVVIVEGFKPEHVNNTRYSLSTKAADSLASGAQIFVYGSAECGVIEYMASTDSAAVCTEDADLEKCIQDLILDVEKQQHFYDHAITITKKNHNLQSSTGTFRRVVEKAIEGYGQ